MSSLVGIALSCWDCPTRSTPSTGGAPFVSIGSSSGTVFVADDGLPEFVLFFDMVLRSRSSLSRSASVSPALAHHVTYYMFQLGKKTDRLRSFGRTQGLPSNRQLLHWPPDITASHRTFLARHDSHARGARLTSSLRSAKSCGPIQCVVYMFSSTAYGVWVGLVCGCNSVVPRRKPLPQARGVVVCVWWWLATGRR
jgi:hypothetical protein